VKFEPHPSGRLLLALSLGCFALGWVFVEVGAVVTEGRLAVVDGAVRRYAQAHQSAPATAFFSAVTMLGSKPILAVFGVIAGWFLSRHSKVLVVLLALCAVASSEFVDFLKDGFTVPRPPTTGLTSRSFAFPSGHVSSTAAIATILTYVAWRRKKGGVLVTVGGVVIVVLMAMSRVYLDRHWASDTVGGALIGMALGFAACALYEWTTLRHLES
jgi:membrane-associated phospholipid phosphatase